MAAESQESRLRMIEQALVDSSEIRERGKRNERDIAGMRGDLIREVAELRGEVHEVNDELRSMYRAFVTAAISFVLASAGIITTLVALFR